LEILKEGVFREKAERSLQKRRSVKKHLSRRKEKRGSPEEKLQAKNHRTIKGKSPWGGGKGKGGQKGPFSPVQGSSKAG